jgi:hypothetical protein
LKRNHLAAMFSWTTGGNNFLNGVAQKNFHAYHKRGPIS